MQTGFAARAVEYGRLQIVEDDGAGTAPEELEGMDDSAVELLLALRERELDVDHPAIAEHGHEHRNFASRVTDSHTAALAPIDLHRLGRFVVDFLVDTPPRGTDLSQVAADEADAAGIAIGAASDLLADAHRREFGVLDQQDVDLGPVVVQEAGAALDFAPRGLVQFERRGHRVPRAAESS